MGRRSQADKAREIGERAERELGQVSVKRKWLVLLVFAQFVLLCFSAMIFLTRPTEGDVHNIIRREPPACRDLDPGKSVQPAPACRDIALLILRECRAEPRICMIAAEATSPAASRALVRREVRRELRSTRSSPTRNSGSRGHSTPSQPASPGGDGAGNPPAPAPPPTTLPPSGQTGQTPPVSPPSSAPPIQPTPGSVVDDVLGDPVGALTDPVDTINQTVCALRVSCDQPIVPPLPRATTSSH